MSGPAHFLSQSREELRIIADERLSGEDRKALLRVAVDYDQMADQLEAAIKSRNQVARTAPHLN